MLPQQIYPAKLRWMGMGLFLILLLGVGGFAQLLHKYETKDKTQELLNKGNSLVSLIALHPLNELKGQKSDFFRRTLSEYISAEGLVYCYIHDRAGNPLISLAPQNIAPRIPQEIRAKSLYTMGLTFQAFTLTGTDNRFYEFAKPIFEEGERCGTARVGLQVPAVSLFQPEHIGLLAMIAFLVLSTVTLGYYGMAHVLQPLRRVFQSADAQVLCPSGNSTPSEKGPGMVPILQDLETSFFRLKENLKQTENRNLEMATKLGVARFEQNQISKIIDSIPFGIIITDIQDHISYINARMLNLLKSKREQVVDRPLPQVLAGEEILSFLAQYGDSQSHGSTETTFPGSAANEVFQVTLSSMKDEEGSVIGKIISARDVTREKSLEKTQQEFIDNIAHEFLTPLTTIKSYNEMLMDNEVEDAEMQKEFYNIISEQTNRLSRLIQNLLNLSKIEMGTLCPSNGLVKTDWLVGNSISAVESNALKKNITIKKMLPDQFPSLIGDKDLLQTAIINVLANAVKYSPKDTEISLSLREENKMVVFDVIDQGFGISDEDLPRIFDRFYRSKDAGVVEQTGSGLGLAMTLEIIQLHSGEIEVHSEPGKGSHFTIRIPKEDYYLGKE